MHVLDMASAAYVRDKALARRKRRDPGTIVIRCHVMIGVVRAARYVRAGSWQLPSAQLPECMPSDARLR